MSDLLVMAEKLIDNFKPVSNWWTFKELQECADCLGIKRGQTQQILANAKSVGALEIRRVHRVKLHRFVEPMWESATKGLSLRN